MTKKYQARRSSQLAMFKFEFVTVTVGLRSVTLPLDLTSLRLNNGKLMVNLKSAQISNHFSGELIKAVDGRPQSTEKKLTGYIRPGTRN